VRAEVAAAVSSAGLDEQRIAGRILSLEPATDLALRRGVQFLIDDADMRKAAQARLSERPAMRRTTSKTKLAHAPL